jgi:hypothetical protein
LTPRYEGSYNHFNENLEKIIRRLSAPGNAFLWPDNWGTGAAACSASHAFAAKLERSGFGGTANGAADTQCAEAG